MLAIYISQPMTGCDPDEIRKERAEAEEYIEHLYPEEYLCFVNDYHADWDDLPPLYALVLSLHKLCMADAAYFVKSWKRSKGCQVERLCCELYGIRIIDEE